MNPDFDDLKQRIRASVRLEDYVRQDCPDLKGGPVEFKAKCPFHQEKTASFTVNSEKGIFHCFGCAATGDIFEWIMRRRGLDFMGALRLLANDCGIAVAPASFGGGDRRANPAGRIYQPGEVRQVAEPVRGEFDPQKYRALVPDGKVMRYLTEKRRLTPEILTAYSVGETADGEAYSFAYKWWAPGMKRGEGCRPRFEFCKVVKVDRVDGKKVEWRDPKGGKNILFGMCAVPDDARELVIAEGEIDAMTWAQYGFPAVSVPGGAGYTGWINLCFDWLQRFTKIYVSFDEDRAGRQKLVEVVTRLGMARTDIVRLPVKDAETGARYKDANECLQAGVTAEEMADCLDAPEVLRPQHLKDINDFEAEIWSKFHPEGRDQLGLLLPWGNSHGSSLPFRFRYGELTVWTGYNKHGKSEVLNHVIVDLCWQGERALICSLEVAAPETYRKVIRMAHGRRHVANLEDRAAFAERILKPLADKIWVYDHVGNANVDEVLNVMLYAYQRFGVRQFVLDSLMRFEGLDGEGQEIWNSQRGFMNKLLNFAEQYSVHVHLVAHSKKPDRKGEAAIPRRYDIMGSSYISNLAFNVIVVWRNRDKQDELEKVWQACADAWVAKWPDRDMPPWKRLMGGPPPSSALQLKQTWCDMIDIVEKYISVELQEVFTNRVQEHDAYLIVDAQRGGDGDTPSRWLWFEVDSLQFLEASPWKVKNDKRGKATVYAERAVTEMDEEL